MINRSSTILLVEDDVRTAVSLRMSLQDQGFRAIHATDGRQGLEWAKAAQPDLVLLDTILPQMDGFAVCQTLRQESVVPIIMLSPSGQEQDQIKGLEIGADDCVAKPLSFQVLLARMRALLRRRELDRRQASPSNDRIVVGDPSTGPSSSSGGSSGQAVVLDRATQQVWRAGQLIEMPQREFDVLRVLMEHAGQAVPRQALMDEVWGEDWVGYPRTLNVHIYRLRQRLEDDPSVPRYIQTVRSHGYRFVDPAVVPSDTA